MGFLEKHPPAVTISFSLIGYTEVQVEQMHLCLDAQQHTLFYSPAYEGMIRLTLGQNLHKKLIISLSEDFFMNLIRIIPAPARDAGEERRQQGVVLSRTSLPVTSPMKTIEGYHSLR
jgi:hypothetical protein